jgi:hypothetical protein
MIDASSLESLWRDYWAECRRGGVPPEKESDMRDAFVSGALSALLRAKRGGRDRAWRETRRMMRAEHFADLAAHAGLRRLEGGPEPAKGWMAY